MNTIKLGNALTEGQTKVSIIVSNGKENLYRQAAIEAGVSYKITLVENYGAGTCFEVFLESPDTERLRDCLNRTNDVLVVV